MHSKKKSFFRERSAKEIRDLNLKSHSHQKGLVKKILSLNTSREALEIRVRITPNKFFKNTNSSAEASRKCYKHGDKIRLSQPFSQSGAYNFNGTPLSIRANDFHKLTIMKEEEINFVGYSFRPVQGRDRRKRVVPFVWLPEAIRLFGYAENMTIDKVSGKKGISITPYADSKKVNFEGANIICTVPSRTKKNNRYKIKLENVPVTGNDERKAIIWSLKSSYHTDPLHKLYNIKYNFK